MSTESRVARRGRDRAGRRDERLHRRPGLERLGDRRDRDLLRIEPAARHRQDLAVVRVEDDDVAALGAHARHGVGERFLGDLLKIGVDRQHDAASLGRRGARRDRRLVALPLRVLEDRRRARNAVQNGIERQLEPVDRLVVGVDVANDSLRALRDLRTSA